MTATTLYVRNTESPTLVRQLTPEQAARCTESPVGSNNYTDSAGAITGTIFGGVSSQGTYCLEFDRWYDPSTIPEGMAPEAFFATQPEAGAPVAAAPQWWTEPTSDPANEPTTEAESEAAAPTPEIPEAPVAPAETAAPVTGSSEPGFVHTEPEVPEDPRAHAQQHINRIHALLDVIHAKLSASEQWAAREIRTILHELGATKSE